MYTVEDLYKKYADRLCLEPIAGLKGIKKKISIPEAHRPGLSLAGYLKNHAVKRVLVFGKVEFGYLKSLQPTVRTQRLKAILSPETPVVIIARNYRPFKELLTLCEENAIPLFRSPLPTMSVLNRLNFCLTQEFSPSMSCHGTLVEVYGVGVLLQGDSSVGKSEAALGLIERGHRLVSDDTVRVIRREGNYLEGSGTQVTRHHMEIRGIGIINVAHLYGAVCVRDLKSIDIIVHLEVWNDKHFYDRAGLDDKFSDLLGIQIPYHILPVKPGRDVVLLLETIALNHRLKEIGYNSAKEFHAKLLDVIAQKTKNPKNQP